MLEEWRDPSNLATTLRPVGIDVERFSPEVVRVEPFDTMETFDSWSHLGVDIDLRPSRIISICIPMQKPN